MTRRFDYGTAQIKDFVVRSTVKDGKRQVQSVELDGEPLKPTPRFWNSLQIRFGFTANIFRYFTHDEVFQCISEVAANDRVRWCVERDGDSRGELLAVTNPTAPLIRHEDGTPAKSLRRTPTVLRALGEAVLGERAGRYPSLGETVVDPAAYRRPGVTDWATGAAMLISADCARACGPWDESFFLYSEETDFALRAGDLGLATAFVPAAEVIHLGGESRVSPALWSLLVYSPLAHWVWAPDGFLFQMGAIDFAGGTVVHISAGISGLVAALYLGARRGYPRTAMHPNNLSW